MTILGQNSPPGDSAQMFPAECGSNAVRGLIREGLTEGFTHIQPDRQWCVLEVTDGYMVFVRCEVGYYALYY